MKEIFNTLDSIDLLRILYHDYKTFGSQVWTDFPQIANELSEKRKAILEILLKREDIYSNFGL